MKSNTKTKTTPLFTHEGARAVRVNPEAQLRRSVMSCMLFENEFYEDGVSILTRIANLIPSVKAERVAEIAIEAREQMKLRHVPLWIVRLMAALPTHRHLVADTLARVIQRADELAEFVAIYWKVKKQPLSAQVKKGLAGAFTKFNSYQLAKYNRDADVKLRDVLFLSHAKPLGDEQAKAWKQLVDGTLPIPDTWETQLSAGADKKETFERLISENKLGGLALLRNLRNMQQAGVRKTVISNAIHTMDTSRILPFRFIAAAKYAPDLEPDLEQAMFRSFENHPKLGGETILLVDVSGSMDAPLSGKSDMNRIDAACGLAMVLRELCDSVKIRTFSERTVAVPARRGFALRDAIVKSQSHSSTYLGAAVTQALAEKPDRLIVISDEQSHDRVPEPNSLAYMINVASNQNGVGYGKWLHVDGFSESIVDYIIAYEQFN